MGIILKKMSSDIRYWLFQLPILVFCLFGFYVFIHGENGGLDNETLREKIFPFFHTTHGMVSNFKFRIRGPEPVKNKIVIVGIDGDSLEKIGRWPWHRDYIGVLIHRILSMNAKVVGLDVVFSEADQRVSDEVRDALKSSNMGKTSLQASTSLQRTIDELETDPKLAEVIDMYKDKVVLGWMTDIFCRPRFIKECSDAVVDPRFIATGQKGFEKFSYNHFEGKEYFNPATTPLMSIPKIVPNLEIFNNNALHSGAFLASPDQDGIFRRTTLAYFSNAVPYPTLPLEMAKVGLKDELSIRLQPDGLVNQIKLKSKNEIKTSPLGMMEINFRGEGKTFIYLSAKDILLAPEDTEELKGFQVDTATGKKVLLEKTLKDAYVLIGGTAIGINDMRAFPFDPNVAGVEGHANILDNILSEDFMISKTKPNEAWLQASVMLLLGLILGFIFKRLESVPSVIVFILSLGSVILLDLKYLFQMNHINLNTSLLYLEILAVFGVAFIIRYIEEEAKKKQIKGAFASYVSPVIVEHMLKNPEAMTTKGLKKHLTIMFSDIRDFTTLSEKLNPTILTELLNDYLGKMTEIVFDTQGTLDKYIGDAVMAFWGAPVDMQNHTLKALEASIKMQKVLIKDRPFYKEKYGVDIHVGIGVNAGEVNVGNMGSATKFEYTVIGDSVNLASRLEGLTKEYGVKIISTKVTLDSLKVSGAESEIKIRVLDRVRVKGKKKAVEIVEIICDDFSQNGLNLFDQGLQKYFSKNWDEAEVLFTRANEELKQTSHSGDFTHDKPCLIFIDRCHNFKAHPPDEDWDGTWVMKTK